VDVVVLQYEAISCIMGFACVHPKMINDCRCGEKVSSFDSPTGVILFFSNRLPGKTSEEVEMASDWDGLGPLGVTRKLAVLRRREQKCYRAVAVAQRC